MTPAECRAEYREVMQIVGETVTVRRYGGVGGSRAVASTAAVLARVTGFDANPLIADIVQGDQKVILLHDDLVALSFPVPLRSGDKVVVRGRELNIEDPDANTRTIAGAVIAYEIKVRG